MSKKLKGNVILLITAVIWGTSFVAQSEGMNFVQPFTFNALRTLAGGVVLVPVILAFNQPWKKNKKRKYSLKYTFIGGAVCGCALCAASSLQQYGIVHTTAGKSGFITALYVIVVPFFEMILGRRQGVKIWLCAFTAIVGFGLLCIKGDLTVGLGDWLTLACAPIFAIQIICVDRFLERGADGVMMACVQFFTAGLIMLLCMLMFETPDISRIWDAKGSILYAGVMSCGVAYTLQIVGQRYAAPTIATLLMSLESVFAALSGWLILGENLSPKELLGCCLVFAAVVFSQVNLPTIKFKNKRKGVKE